MIVGMNEFIFAFFSAEDFVGAVGENFVDVHVITCAGASLENIERKICVKFPGDKFFCGSGDSVFLFFCDDAKFAVCLSGGKFYDGECSFEEFSGFELADLKVFGGADGKSSEVRIFWHRNFAHGILFLAELLGVCHVFGVIFIYA